MKEKGIKVVAENRKAYHEYFIEEKLEAGIELSGTEVKSIRAGRVSLGESYASVVDGELWVHGMHVSPYEQGNRFNKEPMRTRRLLMHKHEILYLYGLVKQKVLTLVPTKLYFQGGRVKVEVGVARGKKLHDKREAEAEKHAAREIDRRMKGMRED